MRILLIRLRQIGDVVFTTPAVHAIRERYPNAELSYVVEASAAPVVLNNPDIDDVIVAPRRGGLRGVAADLQLGRALRARSFDVAIDFHGGPRASLLTWMSGAPQRVGYDVPGRGWMYTTRVPRARTHKGGHSVINQWRLLSAIGLSAPPIDRERFPVVMAVDRTAHEAVAARLLAAGVTAAHVLIVVHVSAGNPFRRWPADSFAALAAELVRDSQSRRIIITSGPSERGAVSSVIAAAHALLPADARARVLACGDFSLAELRALVERAQLYIGGDSGPMHVAATSRVPIVALYGPTLPERSEPWRSAACLTEAVQVDGLGCRPCNQRRCEPGDFRCLTRIPPAQVLAASERLLARRAVQ